MKFSLSAVAGLLLRTPVLSSAGPVSSRFRSCLPLEALALLLVSLWAVSSQVTGPDAKNEACEHCSHCYHEYGVDTPLGPGEFKTLDVSFHEDDPLRHALSFPLKEEWQCDSCLGNMHRAIQMNLRIFDVRTPPERLWISNPKGIISGMSWDSRYDPQPAATALGNGTNGYVSPCDDFPESEICQSIGADGHHPVYLASWGLNGVRTSFNVFLTGCDYWPEKKEVTNTWILADYGASGTWENQIGTSDRDDCIRSHVSPDCQPPAPAPDPTYASVAQQFVGICLDAIRRSIPDPPLHARNLFHLSAAMWDAWVAFDDSYSDTGFLFDESRLVSANDVVREAARNEAVAFAAYRLLRHRYASQPEVQADLDDAMDGLAYNKDFTSEQGSSPAAVGNRVAQVVIVHGLGDGSNEENGYADTTDYASKNEPLFLNTSGTVMDDPDKWQPLSFEEFVTQNGIELGAWTQEIQGPHWGYVVPFALVDAVDKTFLQLLPVWLDPGAPPPVNSSEARDNVLEVIELNSLLDFRTAGLIDISPKSMHGNTLGTNDGTGYSVNPATGQPYAERLVNEADYGRVVAEFWADGPESETPPGHWNVIAHQVRNHPDFTGKWQGEGNTLSPLEWDVRSSFVLNGALHDAAIAAWSNKRAYDYSRPISQIRYMGGKGQSSDTALESYDPEGLPLKDDVVELITTTTAAPGGKHEHLVASIGKVAVRSWRPPSANGVEWILAEDWTPYQRPTFVTPAFPGYVSGHSTFSRAAAEALSNITGSAYFPGGLSEHTIKTGDLEFDYGPLTDVVLSHATYFDASDEAGRSRLWGGIHPMQDDLPGRIMGSAVGRLAVEAVMTTYFVPSLQVTASPTSTGSPAPTAVPSKAPTGAPVSVCPDDPNRVFRARPNGRVDTCAWVAGRPNNRCNRVNSDGVSAAEICPCTCE